MNSVQQDHQQFSGLPNFNTPVIDPLTGVFSHPWLYFFSLLWQRLGGTSLPLSGAYYVGSSGGVPSLFSVLTKKVIGPVSSGTVVPDAQTTIAIGASPVTLVAAGTGNIVVSGGGQVELSRPPGAFVTVGVSGGIVPVVKGDQVRVTWFSTVAPTVSFFPFTIT